MFYFITSIFKYKYLKNNQRKKKIQFLDSEKKCICEDNIHQKNLFDVEILMNKVFAIASYSR